MRLDLGVDDELIPMHGGYRKLKSFQIAQLIYDATVRFCDLNIDCRSRTRDQMVQAARSGVQNIAEGSMASGTSKKTELKLTSVARASLEELRLDYQDFLRQRNLSLWPPAHPALVRFKARRCASMGDLLAWEKEELEIQKEHQKYGPTRTNTDTPGQEKEIALSLSVGVRPRPSVLASSVLQANAVLSLLNLCCFLLDRQLAAQATAFEKEGGFTERLYRIRSERRKK
jgi:four helix bundle suffix protein